MAMDSPEYLPVKGKTYSLFGNSDSTGKYYKTIGSLADEVNEKYPDKQKLIESIARLSSKKRILKKFLRHHEADNEISFILNLIDPYLQVYTENANEHLKSLRISRRWDRILATSREQYHLYMLEIELTNRLFNEEFKKSDRKIALLPHCLQDFSVSCRSEKKGFDYQCNQCSDQCFQNQASEILRKFNIEPYIWMEGNMKKLAKNLADDQKKLGVLGIACIPELTMGMRLCRKNKIPVIGLPLNANRCIRWFGEFFPNNVDLAELERLTGGIQ